MITKFARLEFELFTKPSTSDFLRDRHLVLKKKAFWNLFSESLFLFR
jgi:hypothetical protein